MEHLLGLASECQLDKQEVQDICGHTALRVRKWSDLYVNERQTIGHYRARSTEERRRRIRRKKKNAKLRVFLLRAVRT